MTWAPASPTRSAAASPARPAPTTWMRGGDIRGRYQVRSPVEAFNLFGVLHCDGERALQGIGFSPRVGLQVGGGHAFTGAGLVVSRPVGLNGGGGRLCYRLFSGLRRLLWPGLIRCMGRTPSPSSWCGPV